MTRYVKRKREEIQHKKYRGFLAQFLIFLILRSIDLTASITVLGNALKHSFDWDSLNDTLFNTPNQVPSSSNSRISRSIIARSINDQNILPKRVNSRSINLRSFFTNKLYHQSNVIQNTNTRNIDPRNVDSQRNASRLVDRSLAVFRRFLPKNIDSRNVHHRMFFPRNVNPRHFARRNIVRGNTDHWNFNPRNFDSRNIDPQDYDSSKVDPENFNTRNADPRNFDSKNIDSRNRMPRRLNPGKTESRINNPLIVKRNIDSKDLKYTSNNPQYTGTFTIEQCQDIGSWEKKKVYSNISEYKIIIGLTIFFNIVSLSIFLTHLTFWIITIKTTLKDGTEYQTRVTRLTRNSLLSLITAVFRDVPLSCLNVELLALRSGHEGLACVACIFAGRCPPEEYVENSINLAKSLLYFNYFIMLINSLWKGVSGFYRLSRFKELNIYLIRASASIVFGLLYCIATFTPAMFMFIYRYFAIPGLDAPFLQDLAKRLVVIGAAIWVTGSSVVICCPILYLIRLNAD